MKNKIKERRRELDMSQTELASLSGVSRMTIYKLENDEKLVCTTRTLSKIADALGTPLSELIFWD